MFPGKIDAYRENQAERKKQEERVNAGVLAKKKHLEEFIAKNKARASTATRAKSKEKQLLKLETIEIAGDEPTVSIRAPLVEPRRGSALRCIDLAIGYPERQIASGIGVEVEHGARAAVVGDNGQGKTTFPADDRRLAATARRGSSLGPRLPDRNLRPARLHEPAAEPDGVRVPGKHGPRRDEDPGDLERGRLACCFAGRTSRRRSRCSPAASGPGSVWRG